MMQIFGILNFQKGASLTEDIVLTMSSFNFPKDYKHQVWGDEFICLGQTVSISAETGDAESHSPDFNDDLVIVADARLDNRAELFETLGISPQAGENFDDANLIAACYRKWGEDCAAHLLGNFVFAVWNKKTKKLFLAHDHMGMKRLFYYSDNKRFIFADAPQTILSIGKIEPRLNQKKLAVYVAPQTNLLFIEESWFKGIFGLPAGTSLTVDQGEIRRRKFWEPTLETGISFKSEGEILEAFRALMFQVVSDHLRSDHPVTALLSGGLDSSSVVGVAAKILEKQNKQLFTLSAVLPDENDAVLTDERYFINQMRTFPNVSINYVTDVERGPFDNLKDLFERSNSPLINSRHFLYSAFIERALENSSRVILDGGGGEMGATAYGTGAYAEMLLRFKWIALWRELNLRKELSGESIQYNVRANILNPLIPEFLYRMRHGKPSPVTYLPEKKSLFQNDFMEDLLGQIKPQLENMEDRRRRQRMSPFQRVNQYRALSNMHKKSARGGNSFEESCGVDFRYPFMDKRMLEFCLAVPYNLKVRNGYQRYLIRAGMDKILPPAIQWRTSKEPFSPDYFRRYKRQLPQILDFLADIEPGNPIRKILNIPKIIELAKLPVAEDEKHTFAGRAAYDSVPDAIYLIYFLQQFAEFQN